METQIYKPKPVNAITLINLTPHDIIITDENCNPILVIPRHVGRSPARVRQERKIIGKIRTSSIGLDDQKQIRMKDVEIQISRNEYGEVEGLPDPIPGVYFIVSLMVAQALPERGDLLVPDTGPGSACRDSQGRIVGVKYLQSLATEFWDWNETEEAIKQTMEVFEG